MRFADKIGVSHAAISQWLAGKVPRDSMRQKIAKELGISVMDLELVLGISHTVRRRKRAIQIDGELFDLLANKQAKEGQPGSTEFYIEGLLYQFVLGVPAKTTFRAEATEEAEEAEQPKKVEKRKTA